MMASRSLMLILPIYCLSKRSKISFRFCTSSSENCRGYWSVTWPLGSMFSCWSKTCCYSCSSTTLPSACGTSYYYSYS